MTLSIKIGGYAFLIRLDLMFSMSLWKEFYYKLLQILNDLSIRHWIKLILYENDVKLLRCEILILDTWNEYIKKRNAIAISFFFSKFNARMPVI